MRWCLWLAACAACVQSNAVTCDDGSLCPSDRVCDLTHHLCVESDQISACNGKADLDTCMFGMTDGICHEGTCLEAGCGNGRLDPGEICDDGNQLALDGCSADCMSDETCGNGIIDLTKTETCDDGNLVDHDGCTSTCQVEAPQWVKLAVPSARAAQVAAYDAARDVIVMNGGDSLRPDTWQWRGRWSSPLTGSPPPAVSGQAMAYDANRKRVVMQGGESDQLSGDIREWDGVKWTKIGSGTPLVFHAMAYDSRRKKIVTFGGFTNGQNFSLPPSAQTYEYDGTTWLAVTTPHTPPARAYSSMTYDPIRGVVLMYGGNSAFESQPVLADLWSYDGTDWTLLSSSGPPAVFQASFAFSRTRQAAILYGGFTSSDFNTTGLPTNQTWAWNGTSWSQLTAGPTARGGATLTEDGRGNLLLFGGTAGFYMAGATYSDTWMFDGNAWSAAAIPPAPTARESFGATNNVDQGTLVVFGGTSTATSYLQDTWVLSDLFWKQAATTGPPKATTPGIVYDEKRHQIVQFGGLSSGLPTAQTWIFDGTTWMQRTPASSPPPRANGQLVYDTEHSTVLAFACQNTSLSALANDLWSWDGTTWTELHPAHMPPPRNYETIGYDRIRHQLVVTGGIDANGNSDDTWVYEQGDWHQAMPPANADAPVAGLDAPMVWNPARRALTLVAPGDPEVWEWDGTWWQLVPIPVRPPVRGQAGLVASPDGSGIELMFGDSSGTNLADVWQLRWQGTQGTDLCLASVDGDGDGLSGCADGDCWAVCTPECSPGVSCPTDAPRCGDGVCDATGGETCHRCPMDCQCTAVCGDFVCSASESATTCPGDCP
jgi:cysteine-rich repeat protein